MSILGYFCWMLFFIAVVAFVGLAGALLELLVTSYRKDDRNEDSCS